MVNLCITSRGKKMWLYEPHYSYSTNHYWYNQLESIHRLNGPALEFSEGSKKWYYHGKYIECSTQKEFDRIIKLKLLSLFPIKISNFDMTLIFF